MDTGTWGVILRVVVCCIVFAFFLFVPLRSRFRFSYGKTGILAGFLVVFTAGIGIVPVRRVVEKYNGHMQIHFDGSQFCVNLILNANM